MREKPQPVDQVLVRHHVHFDGGEEVLHELLHPTVRGAGQDDSIAWNELGT